MVSNTLRKLKKRFLQGSTMNEVMKSSGYCPTCDQQADFISKEDWLRDHFLCNHCGSIPRERALMHVIEDYYPNFRDFVVHESSPANRGASLKLSQQCKEYVASQYDVNIAFGDQHDVYGYVSQDLEKQTFEDEVFDLVVTQDVFEHLFSPDRAFAEIART